MTNTPLHAIRDRLVRGIRSADSPSPAAASATGYDIPSYCARKYLDTKVGVSIEESTAETYCSHLEGFVDYLDKHNISVATAEKTDVIEYIEACVRRGNRQSTITGKLSTIKELYKFARLRLDEVSLRLDPIELEEIDLSKYNTPPEIEREALSREEVRLLFDAMESYRNRMMAIVLAETGIRNSELRNMRISDLDLEGLQIRVPDPKNSRPYTTPISNDLSLELEIWLEQYRMGYGTAKNSEFVFPSHYSERIESNGGLNRIIKTAAERAGIQDTIGECQLTPKQREAMDTEKEVRDMKRVTPHTLRHTFITLLQQAGVSIQYRQLVANHASPVTTQTYSHGGEDVFATIRGQFNPPR